MTERFETCDNCRAPLDEGQRYCVECGTRRTGADDPAARYFATAARRARAVASRPAGAAPRPSSNHRRAVVLALLPVAAAIGVQVGRGGNDDELLKALKARKAPVVRVVGGGGTATTETAADTTLASDFALDKGFTVQLKTLPVSGTTQADVDAAVKGFEDKKIEDVGVVSPKDFSVKPSPGRVYAIVSGAFKTRAEAERALKAIKKKVPGAKVVEVSRKAGDSSSGNKVLSRTKYGAARQLTGAKTTQKDIEDSKKALDHIVNSKGKEYVEQQRNLPDTIVIP